MNVATSRHVNTGQESVATGVRNLPFPRFLEHVRLQLSIASGRLGARVNMKLLVDAAEVGVYGGCPYAFRSQPRAHLPGHQQPPEGFIAKRSASQSQHRTIDKSSAVANTATPCWQCFLLQLRLYPLAAEATIENRETNETRRSGEGSFVCVATASLQSLTL